MVRLESALDSWKMVRDDTAHAVEDSPAAELDFKSASDVMTFREIGRHILEGSHAISGLMLDGVENLAPATTRRRMAKRHA